MIVNRALDKGLTLTDLNGISIGMIVDLLAEERHRRENPPKKYATMEDIDAF